MYHFYTENHKCRKVCQKTDSFNLSVLPQREKLVKVINFRSAKITFSSVDPRQTAYAGSTLVGLADGDWSTTSRDDSVPRIIAGRAF